MCTVLSTVKCNACFESCRDVTYVPRHASVMLLGKLRTPAPLPMPNTGLMCPTLPLHESPRMATAGGCLVILLAIVVQLEVCTLPAAQGRLLFHTPASLFFHTRLRSRARSQLFGLLSRTRFIPSAFSRKLTHIGAGTAMTTALVLFPRNYWPARLAVSLSLVAFMVVFAMIAHVPDDGFRSLPPVLRHRLDKLVHAMCRSGDRAELMRGTFYYAFAVATFVLLFWTAPINAVIFASLFIGDGIADPVGRLWASCADARREAAAANATTSSAKANTSGATTVADAAGEKPLLSLQYRVGYFGVKSIPGSLAFFIGGTAAAAGGGALFNWAGHYGQDFELSSFLPAATLCIAAATIAEAIVRAPTPSAHLSSHTSHHEHGCVRVCVYGSRRLMWITFS